MTSDSAAPAIPDLRRLGGPLVASTPQPFTAPPGRLSSGTAPIRCADKPSKALESPHSLTLRKTKPKMRPIRGPVRRPRSDPHMLRGHIKTNNGDSSGGIRMNAHASDLKAMRFLIGTLAMILSLPTFAQAPQNDDEPAETVVVTGSRIARPGDFGNSSPVDTIDRTDIENAGYANLQQLLEKLPANGSGAFSTRGNNQDSTANGAASISLRGLGADATLVLVNGRRVAISPFAESITTNFVDINAIPVSAIERVEVLKDGASALYGSDAVAGVINIILRKDYEGLELSAS